MPLSSQRLYLPHRAEELIRGVYEDNLYYAVLDTDPRLS